ncbi:MAG TPA: hypothetical protein VHS78_07600 [Candidatus Elarobacter sp.]|jgi:hypothetical protein|nr:hypothetical protein [Candidatus Elarobacter sp.]
MSDVLGCIVVLAMFPAWFAMGYYVESFLSGWHELRERFPDRSPMPRARATTAFRFGRDYGHGRGYYVTIGVDERGLHLRTPLLLGAPGHRPLLFPWPTVQPRPAITFWFKPWDVYGVGYFTAIAIPQRSRAASLVREYIAGHPGLCDP